MPYTKDNVPSYVPAKHAAQWAAVWNSAYTKAKKDGLKDDAAEKSAFKQANGVALGEGKNSMSTKRYQETRSFISFEMRATGGSGDADPLVIEGYAAKFNTWSQELPPGFRETIKPGAFTRAIAEGQDVRCLMNHDPSLILGRTKSGTLTLREDTIGLYYRCTLPNTQVARDLHASISRGDIDQCSFSFAALGEDWGNERADNGDWFAARYLSDCDLFDVSPVTYPAYLDTEVNARGVGTVCVPVEVRSMVDTKNAEKREASFEKINALLRNAIDAKFGTLGGMFWGSPKFWLIETYEDYVIVCSTMTDGEYFKIEYEIEDGVVTLEEPEPVVSEQTWEPRALARIAEVRAARTKRTDPDGDGDDDSPLLTAIATVKDAAGDAADELDEDELIKFVAAAQAAILLAEAELAEVNAAPPAGEQRTPDPAATKPHTEGVSKPSPKLALAQAGAKVAAAHAGIKKAKADHLAAKDELAAAGDDETAKASAKAKVAAAKAAMKQSKADHIAATEEESSVKAACMGMREDEDIDDLEEDPDYCGEFNSDEPGAYCAGHEDGDCDDPNCACQNRWNVTADDGSRSEFRAKKVLTKRVGGKDLTKDKFAFVGDPTKTETWKLPIHDEGHAKNALARFSQTQGIPADKKAGVWRKIVAACKAFGIIVSDSESNSIRSTFPPDEHDRLIMLARLKAVRLDE